MKNSLVTCYLLLSILLLFPTPTYSQEAKKVPNLAINELEFDFGKVTKGDVITHTFTLQNKGDATLKIKKVSPG